MGLRRAARPAQPRQGRRARRVADLSQRRRQRRVRRPALGRRRRPAGARLLPLPLRGAVGGRSRVRHARPAGRGRTTCSRASRGLTTHTISAGCRAGRSRACRGCRDERRRSALATRHRRCAGRLVAQRFPGDGRGDVSHLRLRLRHRGGGGGRLQGRRRPLRLLPLRQPDRHHVRGAAAPARRSGGLLRDGLRHVGRLRRARGSARQGRPRRVVSCPLRVVLRHPRRDPAAVGRRERLRRRHRPRRVARGPVEADGSRVLRDARATRCRSSSTSLR